MLVQPSALNELRTVANRILTVLRIAPFEVSCSTLALLCGEGMAYPATSTRKGLVQLRKVGDVRSVPTKSRSKNKCLWRATKWDRAPELGFRMSRAELPTRRRTVSQKVRIAGQTVHYSIGLYPDGSPGELWIEVAKAGAALRAWAGEAAMMVSIALQHGTPLDTIVNLFIETRNQPSGVVEGHDRIEFCTSIMDLIVRDLAITFLGRNELANSGRWSVPAVPISDKAQLPEPVEGQVRVYHNGEDVQGAEVQRSGEAGVRAVSVPPDAVRAERTAQGEGEA